MHPVSAFHAPNFISPVVIALLYAGAFSFVSEPRRQLLNAIIVAGAGGAYLNNGFGLYEFPFAIAVLYCAYQGLTRYLFIGVGWLLHTGWDLAHHVTGNPMLSLSATSSGECAITDALLALWFFAGAPALGRLLRRRPLQPTH